MSNRLLLVTLIVAMASLIGFSALDYFKASKVEAPVQNTQEAAQVGGDVNVDQEIERTKNLQPDRREILEGMIEANLASRIENPSGAPFIYVMEPFFLLDENEQVSLLKVVLYYYMTEDRDSDTLTIFSDDTGQEIGTYTPKGLIMGE